MQEVFRRAHEHKGAAFVEIYQNCNVFNDGAFAAILTKDNRARDADRAARTASRSASVPTRTRACGSTSTARREIVERRRRRRGRGARPRRAPDRPDRRLRALAPAPTTRSCPTPVGVFRASSAPELRVRGAAPARRRAQERQRPRRPRRAHRRPDASGKSTEADRGDGQRASVVEAAVHEAAARLGREVRRLLRHAHARRAPRRGSASTVTGRQQDRGVGGALARRAPRPSRRRRGR